MLKRFLRTAVITTAMSAGLLGGVPAAASYSTGEAAAPGIEPEPVVYEEQPIHHDPRRLAVDYLAWLPYSEGINIEFTDLNPDAEKVAADGVARAGSVFWSDPTTIHLDTGWVDSMITTWGDAPRLYGVILHELIHTLQMQDGQPTIPDTLKLGGDFERTWITLREDEWPEGSDDTYKSMEIAAACVQEWKYPGTAYYVTSCPTPQLVASLEWLDELGGGTVYRDEYRDAVAYSLVGHAVIGWGVQ